MDEFRRIGVLRTIINVLRRDHYVCEDCWYSCPKSDNYCGNDPDGECNCDADITNKLIDATLEETK